MIFSLSLKTNEGIENLHELIGFTFSFGCSCAFRILSVETSFGSAETLSTQWCRRAHLQIWELFKGCSVRHLGQKFAHHDISTLALQVGVENLRHDIELGFEVVDLSGQLPVLLLLVQSRPLRRDLIPNLLLLA